MRKRLLYLACALVALFALFVIVAGNADIERSTVNVDGIPVEVFTRIPSPDERIGLRPAVIIAHGYAGSKQLMDAIALGIARDRITAVTFDFSGHGANTTPLSVVERNARLTTDLDRVIQYVRGRPDVNPDLIALVGHSMGAGVVVPYAKARPEIKAVVSISGLVTDVTPIAPRNLLLMAGALEFESIQKAQAVAFANAGGRQADDPISGRKREVVIIPNVEHITILWSDASIGRISYWVFESLRSGLARLRSPIIPPRALDSGEALTAVEVPWWATLWRWLRDTPVLDAALIAISCFVLFFPLSSFAASRLGLRAAPPLPAGLPYWQVLLVAVTPAVLAPLVLRGLSLTPLDPATWLPIQIVNYMAMHFLLYAALMLAILRLLGVRDLWARIGANVRPAALVLAALFFAWIYVTNGVVAHLTWLNFLPSGGTRLWLWPVVSLLALPYFVLNEYVTKAATLRRSALNELTAKVALIGSLLFAVAITPGLFFLLLVIAVFALFFAVYGVYAVRLHALTGNPLIAALGYAAMTAALLVAVFPITA